MYVHLRYTCSHLHYVVQCFASYEVLIFCYNIDSVNLHVVLSSANNHEELKCYYYNSLCVVLVAIKEVPEVQGIDKETIW